MDRTTFPPDAEEHIPVLSEPVNVETQSTEAGPGVRKNNPFLPYETLERLAQERALFVESLSQLTFGERKSVPPAEVTPSREETTDTQDKNLKILIAHTAHDVFLDFLPAMQEEIFKRLKKELQSSGAASRK